MATKGPAKPGVVRISGSFIAGKDSLWTVSLSLKYQVSSFKIPPDQRLLRSCAHSFCEQNVIFSPETEHTFRNIYLSKYNTPFCSNYAITRSAHCEAPYSCYKLIATENPNPFASPPRNVSLFLGQSGTCSSTIFFCKCINE